MDAKKSFGKQLRTYRRERDLTQEELAHMINRSVDALSNIERGLSLPSTETLIALSESLDIPLANFVKTLDPRPEAGSKELQKLRTELNGITKKMDERQLTIAIGQMKVLAQL